MILRIPKKETDKMTKDAGFELIDYQENIGNTQAKDITKKDSCFY